MGKRIQGVLLITVVALLIVGGYAVSTALYQPRGGFEVVGETATDAQVGIEVDVLDVDPADYSARLRLKMTSLESSLLDVDGRLTRPVRIAVTSSDGTDDVAIPAGSALGRAEVSIGLAGEVSNYPFDVHSSDVTINAAIPAETTTRATESFLTTDLSIRAGTPGWDTTATVIGQGTDDASVSIRFTRSGSIKATTFVILAIGASLALAALIVGLATRLGYQLIDSSILGWGAGLFFALLALRFYLPGDPPIGSGIDVFGYLWIIVVTFVGLILTLWSWLRRKKPAVTQPTD